ncbi:hypothetical protein M3Y99_01974500 [Aphelenchoides fujianensis]|nr:hypothetical protein M3Y99_01974500 [Aphelenchoides fujianensis]
MDAEMGEEHDGSEFGARSRLESCTSGIEQLDALRLKHKLLMEQLRRDYPSMSSLIRDLTGEDSAEDPVAGECNSGGSDTPSHRTCTSADSGYAPEKPLNSAVDRPMNYSTFRKLSLEERQQNGRKNATSSAHIVEATLKSLTTGSRRAESTAESEQPNGTRTWSRLRKVGRGLVDRPRSCYGSTGSGEAEAARPASLIATNGRNQQFLDSAAFAKLTPPPLVRKFNSEQANGRTAKPEALPLVHVRPMPQREQSTLIGAPKKLNGPPVQRAQLRQLVTPPVLRRKPSEPPDNSPLSWQSAAAELRAAGRRGDEPKTPPMRGPFLSSEMQSSRLDRWKKNVAPVAPMPQKAAVSSRFPSGCTTFPSALSRKSALVGTATLSKAPQAHPPPTTYTSSCSIALSTPPRSPDRPLVSNRRPRQWNKSEKM